MRLSSYTLLVLPLLRTSDTLVLPLLRTYILPLLYPLLACSQKGEDECVSWGVQDPPLYGHTRHPLLRTQLQKGCGLGWCGAQHTSAYVSMRSNHRPPPTDTPPKGVWAWLVWSSTSFFGGGGTSPDFLRTSESFFISQKSRMPGHVYVGVGGCVGSCTHRWLRRILTYADIC
jgi:hypothetical protein